MTRAAFDRAEPYLTVVGSGNVHAPTAPRQVLASLRGMTPASVNQIIEAQHETGMNAKAIEEALSPLSKEVSDRLTSQVSSYLRVYVAPADHSGPTIRVDVAIASNGAVRFGYVGPVDH